MVFSVAATGSRLREGTLDVAGGQVGHEEEEKGVCGDVQIEVHEAVDKKSGASEKTRQAQSRGKRIARLEEPS